MSFGWVLRKATRQIWFRAAVYSLVSILLALAAAILSPLMSNGFGGDIGQDSVGNLLNIIASSMLAVTTFSLTAMVSAYGSATNLATPRATQLMIEDPTAQRALSTFLGAFLFSIVGIIALSTGLYGPGGRSILFVGTVILVLIIVATLLMWIAHITAFGRMADVIDRVEDAALCAMEAFVADPYRGGAPAVPIPAGARPVPSAQDGYVTHIDMAMLAKAAGQSGIVHIVAPPGKIARCRAPIAFVEGLGEDRDDAVRRAFAIRRHRDFDQDPRLGVIALSEIASRALSAAVNDPGTAIEVLNALRRVMTPLMATAVPSEEANERLRIEAPTMAELVHDAFGGIVRDGAARPEVSARLQKTLAALAETGPRCDAELRTFAAEARDRSLAAMTFPADRDRLTTLYGELWNGAAHS